MGLKNFFLGSIALTSLTATAAFAADATASTKGDVTFRMPYLSAKVGALNVVSVITGTDSAGASFSVDHGAVGVVGGVNTGLGVDFYNFYAGFDVDFMGSNAEFTHTFTSQRQFTSTFNMLTNLKARLGYYVKQDVALLYFQGGYGWIHDEFKHLTTSGTVESTHSDWHGQWIVGAGTDVMFTKNWGLNFDYVYGQTGNNAVASGLTGHKADYHKIKSSVATFGIFYNF